MRSHRVRTLVVVDFYCLRTQVSVRAAAGEETLISCRNRQCRGFPAEPALFPHLIRLQHVPPLVGRTGGVLRGSVCVTGCYESYDTRRFRTVLVDILDILVLFRERAACVRYCRRRTLASFLICHRRCQSPELPELRKVFYTQVGKYLGRLGDHGRSNPPVMK